MHGIVKIEIAQRIHWLGHLLRLKRVRLKEEENCEPEDLQIQLRKIKADKT